MGPLSLPGILRLQAQENRPSPDTAVIFVLQEGGASQFETYDPKPDAPAEYRGDFGAIRTSVPGVLFSDAMPRQAALMHRMTILRSLHHPSTQHSSSVHLVKTGYYCRAESNDNEMPAVGAYVARVLVVAMGEFGREPRITAINGLPPGRDHWGNVMSVALAGGGLRGGVVVGASDSRGSVPIETPYRAECVLAHLYRHLGIDPSMTFPDFTGRPRNLLEVRDPIRELA